MVLMIESESGHATNVLAADLARENERLTLLVGHLTSRVHELESQLQAMTPATITLSGQTVDLASGLIRRGDRITGKLTRTERRIVAVLAASPGVAVPYERIRDVVWPNDYADTASHDFMHALRVNLMRIRSKLDTPPVRTVGIGTWSRHFFTAEGYGIGLLP